jgi:hypothetical protein
MVGVTFRSGELNQQNVSQQNQQNEGQVQVQEPS